MWQEEWQGEYVSCKGPRGVPLNINVEDEVRVYRGLPSGFPEAFVGGYDVVSLDAGVCFGRNSRYGAYGFRDGDDHEDVKNWNIPQTNHDWSIVRLGALQEDCFLQNGNRYRPDARDIAMKPGTVFRLTPPTTSPGEAGRNRNIKKPKLHHRTVVLF